MTPRNVVLSLLLGIPILGLLAFGPRGTQTIPRDRTVIRYWDKWTGVEGAAIQRIVDRFNATEGARLNLWVDYNALGDVDKRMLIATAGGDPPDLAGLYDRFVPQYADQSALLPLDEAIREHHIDVESLKPIWLDICRYNDQLFALPSTPYTIALFYNRRLFREAGLDPDRPPRTTAELNDYAKKLTRRDGDAITQLGFTISPAMLGWWHWIWPSFFDAQIWKDGRFELDTTESRAAYRWVMEYRNAVGNDAALAFEANCGAIESAQNPFLSEKLAMVFQGPWMANWARVYAPKLDYGVAAFPSVTSERQNVFASADVFVLPRGSKRPREALIFLAYMMRQENLEELCSAHGKGSPFRTPGPTFYRDHLNPKIRTFDELAASPHAFGYPKMPMWGEAWTEMLYLLETVMRGARMPDEAVGMTQRKVEQIVAEWRKARERRGRPTHLHGDASSAGDGSHARPRRRRPRRRESDRRLPKENRAEAIAGRLVRQRGRAKAGRGNQLPLRAMAVQIVRATRHFLLRTDRSLPLLRLVRRGDRRRVRVSLVVALKPLKNSSDESIFTRPLSISSIRRAISFPQAASTTSGGSSVSSSRSASSQRCVRGICIACACNILPFRPSVGLVARLIAVCRFLDVFFMPALYTTGNPYGQIAAVDGQGTQPA